MAKRETYPIHIQCLCGNSGTVIYEENENPVRHGGELNERIISIPENFINLEGKIHCKLWDRKIPN